MKSEPASRSSIHAVRSIRPEGVWHLLREYGVIKTQSVRGTTSLIIGDRFWPRVPAKLLADLSSLENKALKFDPWRLEDEARSRPGTSYSAGAGVFQIAGHEAYLERTDIKTYDGRTRNRFVDGSITVQLNQARLDEELARDPHGPVLAELFTGIRQSLKPEYFSFGGAIGHLRKVFRTQLEDALTDLVDSKVEGECFFVQERD